MRNDVIQGAVRHVLSAAGGIFIAKGWVDDAATWEGVAGAIMTLLAFGLSFRDKKSRE